MRKYVVIIFGMMIMSALLLWSLHYNNYQQDEYIMLRSALEESGFEFSQSRIEASGVISNQKRTIEQLYSDIKLATNQYDPQGNWEIKTSTKENQINIQATLRKDSVICSITMINAEYEKQWSTYIEANIDIQADKDLNLAKITDINKVFDLYGIAPEVCTTIEGTLPKKLSSYQIKSIGKKVLRKLDAKSRGVYQNGRAYSLYGYTTAIHPYYINPVSKEKVNVNVVFRYQETNDTMALYIVTPLMNDSY